MNLPGTGAGPVDVEERSQIPYDDEMTAFLVGRAVDALAAARSPLGPSDPAVRLSCLASLQAEAEGRMDEAVALAYEAGYGWDDIAMHMFEADTSMVEERFSPYVTWRATGMPLPVVPELHGVLCRPAP